MNSIRPLATVAILAVIGVGLYMVINTSEPIPPDEAAGALMDIPQIEEELAGLIADSDPSTYDDVAAVPPFNPGGELAEPPAWSPPPAGNTPPPTLKTSNEAPNSSGAEQPAQQNPATPQPSQATDVGPRTSGAEQPAEDRQDPFSSQLQRHVQSDIMPQEVTNPYAIGAIREERAFGDVPAAGSADNFASPPSFPAAPPASTPFSVARQAIDQTLRQGNLSQALLLLSQYSGDPQLTESERAELDTLLGQLAGTVIYSTEHELEPAYRVQPGETLADIAARFQVTPQLLAKINGISVSMNVPPGTEIKVVRGPFHAVFEQGRLRLVLDGRYAGRFAAGGQGEWSADSWTVEQKVPEQEAAGQPPSGAGKLILLSPANTVANADGAAILAGAPAPGQTRPAVYVSARDMDELYDILTVGSRVTIRK